MNNLKRVLSLALASIMLVGMMAVGASATSVTFSDDAEISKKEAVGTMTALNIIDGMGDGTFDPKGLLLREQAAKMVFVALNGGQKNDNLTTKAVGTFSDVKAGSWAEGYIEWCYNRGIIAGMGDGTFNPKGNLTGTQLAKIMLVAIGYDAKEEGLEGTSDWALNVNALALNKGFYKNLPGIDPEANISREDAAQLILNACNANMVEYDYKIVGSNGQIDTKAIVKDKNPAETILTSSTSYDMDTDSPVGVLTGVTLSTSGATKGTYTVVLDDDENYTFAKITTDYSGLLGQKVTVLKKTVNGNVTVYGVFPNDVNDVVDVKVSALTKKADGTGKNIDTYIVDGEYGADYTISAGSFDTAKLIDNAGNGKHTVLVVTSVDAGKVTYSSSSEIIVNGENYSREDDVVPTDVKKGDYVSATYDYLNDVTTIAKLEGATAKPAVKADSSQYQFDGTWYNKGEVTVTAGTEYTYYTLNGVMVAAVEGEATTSLEEVVMILKTAGGLKDQVRVMHTDGTKEELYIVGAAYADDDVDFNAIETDLGGLYLMTKTDEGAAFYDLPETVASTYTTLTSDADLTLDHDDDKINKLGSYAISDDAIVMVYGGDALSDGKIITGKVLKSNDYGDSQNNVLQNAKGGFISKVNGLTRASVLAVAMHDDSTSFVGSKLTGTNFGLIVADAVKVDSKTIRYTVWTGESNEVVTDTKTAIGDAKQFTVINYDTITDGKISGVQLVNVVPVAVKSTEGSKLWTDNETSYKLTSDTVYLYADTSTTTANSIGKASGTLEAADEVLDDILMPNVKFIDDGAGNVAFALVDVKNQLKDAKTNAFYHYTATETYAISADATIKLSKKENIRYGETLTATVSVDVGKTLAETTLKLTNAVALADGTDTITVAAIDNSEGVEKATATYKIVVTNDGVAISADD